MITLLIIWHSTVNQDLLQVWDRCHTGGYNWGACLVMTTDGLLANCPDAEAAKAKVPPGVIFKLRDQFAASPESVLYKFALFHVSGLRGFIGKIMDECGYSQALHEALSEAMLYLQEPRGSIEAEQHLLSRITNVIPNASKADEDAYGTSSSSTGLPQAQALGPAMVVRGSAGQAARLTGPTPGAASEVSSSSSRRPRSPELHPRSKQPRSLGTSSASQTRPNNTC